MIGENNEENNCHGALRHDADRVEPELRVSAVAGLALSLDH